jgi:hypothetical protein
MELACETGTKIGVQVWGPDSMSEWGQQVGGYFWKGEGGNLLQIPVNIANIIRIVRAVFFFLNMQESGIINKKGKREGPL